LSADEPDLDRDDVRRHPRTARSVIAALLSSTGGSDPCPHHLCLRTAAIAGEPGGAELVVSERGVRAVCGAMRMHPNHGCVQSTGCLALANLTAGFAAEARWQIFQENGLQLVADALCTYKGDREVQRLGCMVIFNVCRLQSFGNFSVVGASQAQATGGLQCVVNAVSNFRQDTPVLTEACNALAVLCCLQADVGRRDLAVRVGAVEAVIAALHEHRENIAVVKVGCTALEGLAALTTGRQRAVSAGGIERVVEAAMLHHGDQTVRACCCGALAELCESSDGIGRVLAGGGQQILMAALRGCRSSEFVMLPRSERVDVRNWPAGTQEDIPHP
jgi:hypothetical protein